VCRKSGFSVTNCTQTTVRLCPECGNPDAIFKMRSGYYPPRCHECHLAQRRKTAARRRQREKTGIDNRLTGTPGDEAVASAGRQSPCTTCRLLFQCRESVRQCGPVGCEPGSWMEPMYTHYYTVSKPASKVWEFAQQIGD